ncbi:hypothetical protein B0T18DRAFT_470638 [Schizothecium vesticola]|uniref:Uncharacterized protein n=1 Tax=Schizothecium vesticola TaxID=314040 RepID=A0AA40BTI0_9PEZI|nr:hypothetical protein B0T18DRAFT_470638 [Schizothecium vesticola]
MCKTGSKSLRPPPRLPGREPSPEPQTQPEDQPAAPRDVQQNGTAKGQDEVHPQPERNGPPGPVLEADMSLAPEGGGVGELGPDEPVTLTKVLVIDGDGKPVGEVPPLSFTNPYIEKVLTLPIRRHVQMRPRKKLTAEALETISKPKNNQGAKWMSCYIQATGEIQEKRCSFCTTSGPFQDCVVVSGMVSRCGCCVWARQACSFMKMQQDALVMPIDQEGVGKRPSPIRRRPTRAEAAAEGQLPLLEITKDILKLRDNGVVFTDPPAIRGVPLAKISKNHPYWEGDWEDLEATVTASLRQWEAKYKGHIAAYSTSSKCPANRQSNRQIKRGKAVLQFLNKGELHPFQIIGKAYVKKQLGDYDKLFETVATTPALRGTREERRQV